MINTSCKVYCHPGETLADLEKRLNPIMVSDNSQKWSLGNTYCYSTPIMSGYGVANLSPFACVIITPEDNLPSITLAFQRLTHYASQGSGVSLYLGDIRSMGAFCNGYNLVQGIMPFVKLADSTISAIKQTSLRDGAGIAWLNVDHPEIEEFLTIGDPQSTVQKLKTGVVITDEFMNAVKNDTTIRLKNSDEYYKKYPHCNTNCKVISARALLNKIAAARLRKGNPSLFFRRKSNVKCPNLCCEVLLDTSTHQIEVCCLATVNLSEFLQDTMKLDRESLYHLMYLLIIKLQDIRKEAENKRDSEFGIIDSIPKSRAVGLGLAGIFDVINRICNSPQKEHSKYYIDGVIADIIYVLRKLKEHFPNVPILAIAPNTYTSIIMGCSAGVSPRPDKVYTKHLSNFKKEVICPVWDDAAKDLFYMSNLNKPNKYYIDVETSPLDTNLMEYIVYKLTPYIDQGISCSTIYDLDSNESMSDLLKRHSDHIETLYYAGFKTVYYHSTITDKVCNLGGDYCQACEN